MRKIGYLVSVMVFFLNAVPLKRVRDFCLFRYGKEKSERWKLVGKEAVVFDKYVNVKSLKATTYYKGSPTEIRAKNAYLNENNREEVVLKEKVEIINGKGLRLVTDQLNWYNKHNLVETDEWVKIEKNDSIKIIAKGLEANTQLNTARLNKEINVRFQEDKTNVAIITCDGPLEIDYNRGIAVFNNNVKVNYPEGEIESHSAIVYFSKEEEGKVKKVIAEGRVKIVRGKNVAWAEKVTYFYENKKAILEGQPRLVIYLSEGKKNENFGSP